MRRAEIDELAAFALLRDHARATNRKVVDISAAVVDSHPLLPKQAST